MFTGLITHLGKITRVQQSAQSCQFEITVLDSDTPLQKSLGASICCNGICLTVTSISDHSFTVDVSSETLSKTTAENWQEGYILNLENSLKLGDELGGHFVFGHVDCMTKVVAVTQIDNCYKLDFYLPSVLEKLVAVKGSIAINGVSLTVNEVSDRSFSVMIIPHTWENTMLHVFTEGLMVNFEADMLARYVARQLR